MTETNDEVVNKELTLGKKPQEFNFTPEQQNVVDVLEKFFTDTDTEADKIGTLVGVAGAGKTYCLRYLIQKYKQSYKICGATVSHSAKDVLSESLQGIPCFTIAQLLNLKRQILTNGDIKFIPDRFNVPSIANYDRIIIDECSMIGDEIFGYIMSHLKVKAKVLFVGDPFQLPPVEENDVNGKPKNPLIPITKSRTFEFKIAELFKAVRYSGPLLDFNTKIRDELVAVADKNKVSTNNLHVINKWQQIELCHSARTSVVENSTGYVFLNQPEQVIKICKHFFNDTAGEDDLRVIAYRNNTLSEFNKNIRRELFDEYYKEHQKLESFMPGELIVSNSFYSYIKNNDIFKVINCESGAHTQHETPCLLLTLKGFDSLVPVVDPNNCHDYKERLSELKKIAKGNNKKAWVDYYNYRDSFAYFDYSYTQTSHRSQGRTYKNTVVIEEDILTVEAAKVSDRIQSLYVATSRSKEITFIYNTKFAVDNSNLPDYLKDIIL